MKRIYFVITVMVFLVSCSSQGFFDRSVGTNNRLPNAPKSTDQIELTILYPYMLNMKEYLEIFEELNVRSRDLLGITVRMITNHDDANPGTNLMHLGREIYTETLEAYMNAGLGPDIFAVLNTFSLLSKNTLVEAVRSGYAADITDFINRETPYIYGFINEYSNLLPKVSVQNRIYGIMVPPTYLNSPVFFVHKTISRELVTANIYTFQDAINACIELYNKGLLEDKDQIHFNPYFYILSYIIQEAGYDQAFEETIPYMYYLKHDDATKRLYRIEETTVLEKIFEYRNLFEQYSIDTTDIDKEKRLIAGVTLYSNLLTDRYNFNKDKLEYDVFFLDNYRSFLSNQGNTNHHNMFVVSETCSDKQAAVQYIDWLFSDTEANKLIKYGIENVHYKVDSTGMLYTDETVRSINPVQSLFAGFTVDNGILAPESIYLPESEAVITERMLKSYEMDAFSKLVMESITDINGYEDSIEHRFHTLRERMDFNIWCGEEINWKRIIIDLLDYRTKADYSDIYQKIASSRKDDYVNELQSLLTR
jgi:maltose-binding protein MalE